MKPTHNEGAALLFVRTRQFVHGLKDLYACIIVDVDGICIIVSKGGVRLNLLRKRNVLHCAESNMDCSAAHFNSD